MDLITIEASKIKSMDEITFKKYIKALIEIHESKPIMNYVSLRR